MTFFPPPHLHVVLFSLTVSFHSALVKQPASESHREPEKKSTPKASATEPKTSHLSQAHLLVGAVKRRKYAEEEEKFPSLDFFSLLSYLPFFFNLILFPSLVQLVTIVRKQQEAESGRNNRSLSDRKLRQTYR